MKGAISFIKNTFGRRSAKPSMEDIQRGIESREIKFEPAPDSEFFVIPSHTYMNRGGLTVSIPTGTKVIYEEPGRSIAFAMEITRACGALLTYMVYLPLEPKWRDGSEFTLTDRERLRKNLSKVFQKLGAVCLLICPENNPGRKIPAPRNEQSVPKAQLMEVQDVH